MRETSGRSFNAVNVKRLTDAAGNQGLKVLVADPNFERTGRPYRAAEQTHRDTGESHG